MPELIRTERMPQRCYLCSDVFASTAALSRAAPALSTLSAATNAKVHVHHNQREFRRTASGPDHAQPPPLLNDFLSRRSD